MVPQNLQLSEDYDNIEEIGQADYSKILWNRLLSVRKLAFIQDNEATCIKYQNIHI